jgi:hypothetical protein
LLLNELDYTSFLIAAIIHDYKHPGLTNGFLMNSRNEVAVKYNGKIFYIILDQSVLENYHVAEAFRIIIFNEECNIFSDITLEDYKLMRKRIIECVLATDMTQHAKELNFLKLKVDNFEISKGDNLDKVFSNLDSIALFNTQQEFLNTLLHMADISNPTKPIEVYSGWVERIMDEFWQQGDREKDMKLPISFLCDRTTTKIPNSQIGFIDGIVLPLAKNVVEILPGLGFIIDNINENRGHYKKLKEEAEKILSK